MNSNLPRKEIRPNYVKIVRNNAEPADNCQQQKYQEVAHTQPHFNINKPQSPTIASEKMITSKNDPYSSKMTRKYGESPKKHA